MAGPAPGTKEQTALRWNQEVFLKPSRGRASPHKLLWTTFFVTLVLTLSLYATRAAPASQIKAADPAIVACCSTSTSLSTPFPTSASLAKMPTPNAPIIKESAASATTASTTTVATQFPPQPDCFPFSEIVMNLQPVPNSTSSGVAWQYVSVLHTTSDLSHSIAADHASKASIEWPTATDTQRDSGQNSSAGQLVRQPSLPVNFVNRWSVPVISVLCVVLSWRQHGLWQDCWHQLALPRCKKAMVTSTTMCGCTVCAWSSYFTPSSAISRLVHKGGNVYYILVINLPWCCMLAFWFALLVPLMGAGIPVVLMGAGVLWNVWMPSMDHSSFVRMRNAGLSTLGVMLIGAMPNEPVWVYLGFRCVVTLATFLASLAQELPSSMLPIDPALTPAGQPSVALPVKAPAASMNTQSGAFTTNGQPSMAPPSKAAATDMLAAAGLSFTRVSSVDQPHTGDMSTSEAPSPTRPLSRLPRRVREAARVEPISTEKAGSTAGKAEPLAAKGQQPVSPKAQPSNSCPSVLAANAGISSADSPADMSNSTSPIKGVVETAHSEPTGPETFEEPLAKVNALRPMTPSDESFAKSTIAASPDGFTFFSQTAAVAPPGPKHGTDAMTDAVFKFFPKQPAVSQPLHSGSLPLLSSPLLPDAEMASEAHSVQPDAMPNAAGMPRLPSVGEAIAEVAPMPSSKNSTKPPRHPRIKALLGSRGKGQPVMPPAITPTKSPAPVPTGSFVGAVMGEPTTPGPVLASPSVYAKIESLEPPTPGTPMGSPMNWSPIPLMADAAPSGTSTEAGAVPFGTLSKALNTHSIAGQILSPIESELSTVKSPLKSLSKAFALPRKAPEKASTRGKGLAGSPPAKVASKLLSPIKIIFGSSTAAGKVDAASDQLPLTSSLAQEASVPTTVLAHSVDPGAAAAAASSSVQSTTNAPISPPRVHSQAGNPAADSAPFVGTSGANCMPSFLGTSRSPIRKPDLLSDVNSKAVLTKLAGSQSIRTSTLALPRAPHRAGVPQPGTAAPEKGPSRNPFATFGLPPSQTAPEGVSVKSSSLLRSRSVLKRLASKGKENSVAGSSSHVEVASVSAHQQPLAISSKFGGVTGAHSSLLTSRPVSEQSSGIGHQTLNAPSFRAQPVSVLSSSRSSPVQPQLFASNHAVPVAAVSSISHGDAAVKVHQDISDGKSASFSSSPKMGSALDPPFRPQQAASTMSRARPSSAIDSMAHQGINLSFTSSPKLSPLVLAPREATSLTPWRVAATPGSVLTHVHSADPDQAMLHAPQKPHAISTPVFEGTRLFKLGKLDRGRPRLVKKAGQERTKVPPAPVHQSVRQLIPQTPSADGGFNSLLMGGRQLAFQDPAAAAPGEFY